MALAPTRRSSNQRSHAAEIIERSPPNLLNLFYIIFFFALIVIEMDVPYVSGEAHPEEDVHRIAFPLYIIICVWLLPATFLMFPQIQFKNLPWTSIILFFIYALWCLVSALWSPMRVPSAVHALVLFLTLFLAIIGADCRVEKVILIFVSVCLFIFVLSWSSIAFAPDYALRPYNFFRLKGVMMHEFRLGYLAGMSLICCVIAIIADDEYLKRFKAFFFIAALISLFTLLATQTRSLTVYTIICVSLAVLMSKSKGAKFAWLFLALFMTLLISAFFEQFIDTVSRGESDASLTGRMIVWEWSWTLAKEHFWFGTGFKSYLHPVFDSYFGGYRPPHAHNDVMNALVETGLIGATFLILFNLFMLFTSWKWAKTLGRPSIAFLILLLSTLGGLTGLVVASSMATMFGVALVFYIQEGHTVGNLRIKDIQKSHHSFEYALYKKKRKNCDGETSSGKNINENTQKKIGERWWKKEPRGI